MQGLKSTDVLRAACCRVHVNDYGTEDCLSFRNLETVRQSAENPWNHDLPLHSDHGISWSGHAHVGQIGCTSREDPLVGGLHMGVCSNHGAGPAVQIPSKSLLL